MGRKAKTLTPEDKPETVVTPTQADTLLAIEGQSVRTAEPIEGGRYVHVTTYSGTHYKLEAAHYEQLVRQQ